ncbi:MAG: hypothetical protein JNM76_04635 [Betaproteobacteria bacterium]|nr:hypothetical protein [Betaproteobacteria bacterium]
MDSWLIIGALVLIGLSWLGLILPPGRLQSFVGLTFGLGMVTAAFVSWLVGGFIWIALCVGFAGVTCTTLSILGIRKQLR